jgi:NADH-ubiquinone oxidoreductase chain 2
MPKIAIIILASEIINTINLDVLSSQIGAYSFNLIKNLLLISSFLSLIIGTIVGLAQTKIKRLLAYSTISHVGFLLLALSINTEESLESLLFYLIQYSFTNLNIFLIILSFGYILKRNVLNNNASNTSVSDSGLGLDLEVSENKASGTDINLISELKGQFISNPLLSLSMAISLFSMAGIPPLLGFFAKAGVLYSSTQNGYYFISIVAIIVSVISAYYYLQIIKVMHFDNVGIAQAQTNNNIDSSSPTLATINQTNVGSRGLELKELNPNLTVTNTHSFIISILTLSIILFILKPSILLNSIHLMALNIFYF